MMSGKVQVTTVDEDHQEVLVDEPSQGQFFGFASMLEQTPHQTTALAIEETSCIEISRDDIAVLLQRKPMAGMDMLTVLGRQFHASQQLVRGRANRNANEVIEEESTLGERIADTSPWIERARGAKAQMLAVLDDERAQIAAMPFTEAEVQEALNQLEKKTKASR